ncbi:MAG: hypothetical protein ACKV2T_27090 [Kofleriaceae bacterium]
MKGPNVLSRVAAIDNAVPGRVIKDLRAAITSSQAMKTSDAGTYWYALDTSPRVLFEHVIHHLRDLVPGGHEFVGAEWWFRATTTDTGFPFHFDRDEGVRGSVVSPGMASILYASHAGGPTVIVAATPSRRAAPRVGIAVHPRPGRFVMFPGTLLHGVVPARASRWPRVTMLVNWWRSVPTLERATAHLDPPRRRWRLVHDGAKTPAVKLESFDPTRLLSKAAWRDLISKQATYR